MIRPEQVVIFCGGLGTRLRPLTDTLPKPMVPVNGKPFLEHLIKQLADQGCKRFLILTGYLGEIIHSYFGDGSYWGWRIDYSHGPTEWETGRRLWEARKHLDTQFLLLYADNFVQFKLSKLMDLNLQEQVPLTLLLAPKRNGNIRVSSTGRVDAYVKTRIGQDLNHVEIGYMIVERDSVLSILSELPGNRDFSFSEVLQSLVASQKLAGLVIDDPYHSISDPKRHKLMCDYLRVKKILLIDRDGTINEKADQGEYISNWSQFRWLPDTLEGLRELAKDGFKFIVITNQAGIARKKVEPNALEEIHQKMTKKLAEEGIHVLKIYVSPHHWDENSFMRKPAPGMFFQAAKDFNLRMDRTLYVGDDKRDCIAASNAGCGMVYLPNVNEIESQIGEKLPEIFFQGKTLLDKTAEIKACYSFWEESE